MNDVRRVAVAARVFALAVIFSTATVGDVSTDGVWFVLGIAAFAEVLSACQVLREGPIAVVEGALAAAAASVSFPSNEAALPYLATAALIAGIFGGIRWSGIVLAAEAAAIVAVSWVLIGSYDADLAAGAVTWLTTGLGLGLLGSFTRHNITRSGVDATYRSALELIKQLHALSGRLTSGLDPVDLADQALAALAEEIVVRRAVVAVRGMSGDFTPLRYSDGAIPFAVEDADDLLYRCWQTRRPVLSTSRIALPLLADTERVAVVLADCPAQPDKRSVERAMERLDAHAVRLNAALLFTSVRESATSEERMRLAREVHDGVAQDVASLGYLIDNVAVSATDPDQVADVARLRKEVSRVVAELRNSVFDLRNEVGTTQGLGQSVASFARHIGSHSHLTVHVTLDESTVRLRPRVEAELLRIAQEAINNVRRHSGGRNLWVDCRVQPPRAQIAVVDDGDGLGVGREDSHGLKIMRERADRIGAELVIESPAHEGRGTRVCVRLD
ncbi:signal transduction histidine kinase [Marmoricola sp. URHA0025 HA25]